MGWPPPVPDDAVRYIDRTRALYASQKPYRWVEHDPETDAPAWAPFPERLGDARVALLSSGGAYRADQTAFHFREDSSHREIPADTPNAALRIAHFGYDVGDARRDPGCVFPLAALRTLAHKGVIGELADPALSFMGGIYSSRRVRDELAPRLRDIVLEQRVDLALLVPA